MHDPELFERPFEFLPERYLKHGEIDPSVPDAEIAAFGFGRRLVIRLFPFRSSSCLNGTLLSPRICPGRFFSNDALFLFATALLSAFNITPPKDATGKPLPMELEFADLTIAWAAFPLHNPNRREGTDSSP